ncbi:MAG: HAD hydrolase family protein [Dehalococcoidia bacterium]
MIRLVALDIDGTLLDSRDRLSPAVAEAVRRASAGGVAVALATGRWYASARRWAGRLDATAPIISHSGARVTRQDPEDDLLHLTLPLEPMRAIVAFMDACGAQVNLTVGPVTYTRPRPGLDAARLPADLRAETAHLPFLTAPPTTALVFDAAGITAVCDAFERQYGGVIQFLVNRTSGTSDHLTMQSPATDKGRALLRVCEELGIAPDETLAIGDAESDTAMFRVAGMSVAMGNANAAVQARATAVAPSNDEDGVAWALARFL